MNEPLPNFQTERLSVMDLRSVHPDAVDSRTRGECVALILTEHTTAMLPEEWRGDYAEQQAETWIAELEQEASIALAVRLEDSSPVGLLILFAEDGMGPRESTELRIGYVVGEQYWGQGFATEIIQGLLAWCDEVGSHPMIRAGVASDNIASQKVLAKAGFELVDRGSAQSGELVFERQM